MMRVSSQYKVVFCAIALYAFIAPGCIQEAYGPTADYSAAESATIGSREAAVITLNGLTLPALAFNSLVANQTANKRLIGNPLSSQTYDHQSYPETSDGYLIAQLADPWARSFMAYVAECALDDDQQVSWRDPGTGDLTTWSGAHGLCPSWHDGSIAGTKACQELVSACLLARFNRSGERVPISLRGRVGGRELTKETDESGFFVREGAVYGNLFAAHNASSAALRVSVRVEDGIVIYASGERDHTISEYAISPFARAEGHRDYIDILNLEQDLFIFPNAYTCWDEAWEDGLVLVRYRYCSDPSQPGVCVAAPAGPCQSRRQQGPQKQTNEGTAVAPEAVCNTSSPESDYFDECRGRRGRRWRRPLTIFLDEPCTRVPEACERRPERSGVEDDKGATQW